MSDDQAPRRRGRPKKEPAGMGDNSGVLSSTAGQQIRGLAGRIINLLNDRDAVNADIKEVFKESADAGFDTKIMRKAIARARQDDAQRQAEEDMISMYHLAIMGQLMDELADQDDDTPGRPAPMFDDDPLPFDSVVEA
jgi:uncharacterized protein (UPF0335 family)